MKDPGAMHQATPVYGDEWDLGAVFRFARVNGKLLVLATVLGALAGVALSYAFKPVYRADAVLIPTADDLAGGAQSAAMAGGLGSLASLVGFGSPGSRDSEALATLKSRSLIEDYVRDNDLLPVLFESEWDASAGRWETSNPEKIPTLLDAYKLFDKKLRKVTEDKKNGLVLVSVEWTDRDLAQQWVRDFVQRTNTVLRGKAIERSNRNLVYLNEQLEKTSVLELRSAIYKLIETEIKKAMLAKGSEDYAFRYIDAPVRPEKKIFPQRFVFFFLGGLFGLSLATGYRVVRPNV